MGTTSSKREVRVIKKVIVDGLYGAGKTTLLYQAKLGKAIATMHSIDVNIETIEHKDMRFQTWDLGGREKARVLHRHFIVNSHAYIYMVDSCDVEKLEEAYEDELSNYPVLILANKQDILGAMSVERISEALDVQRIRQTKCVMPVSANTGAGIPEALEWLYVQLQNKYRKASSKVPNSDNVEDEGLLSPTFVNKLWTSMGRLFWLRK